MRLHKECITANKNLGILSTQFKVRESGVSVKQDYFSCNQVILKLKWSLITCNYFPTQCFCRTIIEYYPINDAIFLLLILLSKQKTKSNVNQYLLKPPIRSFADLYLFLKFLSKNICSWVVFWNFRPRSLLSYKIFQERNLHINSCKSKILFKAKFPLIMFSI